MHPDLACIPNMTRIVELAAQIAEDTAIVDKYFAGKGIPTPSFEIDGPSKFVIPSQDSEAAAAHRVVEATRELHMLMVGPGNLLASVKASDLISLQAIYRYDLANAFPVGQEASFEAIAQTSGLNVVDLRRVIRHAMQNHIFREPRPGIVAHTASSRLLAEDEMLRDLVGIRVEEEFPASAHVVEALTKFGRAQDPSQTGFSLGHNTTKGLYDDFRDHPERGRRFARGMSSFATKVPLTPVFSGFEWDTLPPDSLVVDVGGGYGPVSIGLAQRYPHLKFLVQDYPDIVTDGPAHVPLEVASRVEFMPHSFLDEQPIKGAAVYFFRAIFHNWPDPYCVRILRNLRSALQVNSWILIVDPILQDPGVLPSHVERANRTMDLTALTYFGSRQKTVDEWRDMLKEADPSFELVEAKPAGMNYMLNVRWRTT